MNDFNNINNQNDQNNQSNEITQYKEFEQMGLKESILRGIYAYGFEHPSKIQSLAICPIIKGGDIIAQAQSGTGKTGTFVISTLERVDESIEGTQCIIVSHTRELAIQTQKVALALSHYTKINFVLCIGKTNIQDARRELKNGPTVANGTPGRILDMINRKYLLTDKVKMLVLDEADEMLSSSFREQVKSIILSLPEDVQICIFSATMPQEALEITTRFMINPTRILVKHDELTLEGIKQFYVNVRENQYKFLTLCDIYQNLSIAQSIIFVNTKKCAEILNKKLTEKGFTVSMIHSEMEQTERTEIMTNFRAGSTRILISTDLLARGIDVHQVSLVINYDIPSDKECYIHRIGRSGRFGRRGRAINFATDRDLWKIEDLQRYYETQINELPENYKDVL